MLCKGEPTGTALESPLRKQRHEEKLGRRQGCGQGSWQQQKTPKGDTETISWWEGDEGRREMWQTLEEKWNNWEMSIVSWPALRAEGGVGFTQGLGHLCCPCQEGTAGHPSPAWATLALNKAGRWALGKEEPVPLVLCLGVNSCYFLKSQSCFNFMWQEKPNSWCSFSLQLFNVASVTQFAPAKIRVRPESNHPCKQQLQVTPEHPCCGERLRLVQAASSLSAKDTEVCYLLMKKWPKKGKKTTEKRGKWGSEVAECCHFAVVSVVVQSPYWERWEITKLIILTGIFSAVFPAECECLFSCRQMDRACRITFTGEKPALKSFDSRHGIWSISIEMSSLSFIFCQMPISS